MGRRADAALAALALAVTAAAAAATGAPADPVAIAAGACGALALEGALSIDAGRVRRLWARPGVKAGGVALAALGALIGFAAAGPAALTALAAGLAAYLLLLSAVSARETVAAGRRRRGN